MLTPDVPRICTSIPAPSTAALKTDVKRAFENGSDYVEVRLDYLTEFNIEEIRSVLQTYAERCVYTCRKQEEGGLFRGSEEARLNLLKNLAEQNPAFVDLELSTVIESPELIDVVRSGGSKVIVSWHDYAGTPNPETLDKMRASAENLGNITKIVTLATTFVDNTSTLSLYRSAAKGRLIAFCMGEPGVLSRVLCPLLGSPFTYAALEDQKTAPGQISLNDLREFYAAI
jgi:3-dehydroquinate dehydratase-1